MDRGVALLDDAGQMEQLREEYQEAAGAMNHLGYNGDTLDVVPNKAKKAEIPSDEEAQTEHIVKNKLINKPGGGCSGLG